MAVSAAMLICEKNRDLGRKTHGIIDLYITYILYYIDIILILYYIDIILYYIILYWYYIILYWYYIISLYNIIYIYIYIYLLRFRWLIHMVDPVAWRWGPGNHCCLGYVLNAICKPTCSWVQQQNLVAGWPTPTVSGKPFKIPWFQSPPSRNFKGKECLPQRIMASSFPMHAFHRFRHSISALRGPRQSSTNAGAKQQVLRIQQDLRRDSTSEHGILVGIPPSLPMLRHSFFTLKP